MAIRHFYGAHHFARRIKFGEAAFHQGGHHDVLRLFERYRALLLTVSLQLLLGGFELLLQGTVFMASDLDLLKLTPGVVVNASFAVSGPTPSAQ